MDNLTIEPNKVNSKYLSVTGGLEDIQMRETILQALRWEFQLCIVFEMARRVKQRGG